MKIHCPECKQVVPADQVNMSTDLALCPQCNEGFKVSANLDTAVVNADFLLNPPQGAWVRKEGGNVVVGASTSSPAAALLVPFMCVWTAGSIGAIYGSQIAKGEFSPAMSLIGIPFILAGILFWNFTLMAIWGKVEVSIGDASSVFVGMGPLGWTRHFDWSAVQTIREAPVRMTYRGAHYGGGHLGGTAKAEIWHIPERGTLPFPGECVEVRADRVSLTQLARRRDQLRACWLSLGRQERHGRQALDS